MHCGTTGPKMSEAYLLAGPLADAKTWAGRTLQFSRERKERGKQAYALRLLGEIAAHHDPPEVEQAEAHYCQALAVADELAMPPLQAHCHRGPGIPYGQARRADQAREGLSTAIKLYSAMEMTFWVQKADMALAQLESR